MVKARYIWWGIAVLAALIVVSMALAVKFESSRAGADTPEAGSEWHISKGFSQNGRAVPGSYIASLPVKGIDFQIGCNGRVWAVSVNTHSHPGLVTDRDRVEGRGEYWIDDGLPHRVYAREGSPYFTLGGADLVRKMAAANVVGFRYKSVFDESVEALVRTTDLKNAVRDLGAVCGKLQ
jgi:hypothetical protein